MARVALISDLHFDVNQVDPAAVLPQQAAYLKAQNVALYLIAGDLTNHFNQSLAIVQQLQTLLAPAQVRFIAGNHDMLHDVSYAALETPLSPLYLHHQFYDLPGTNWRIIGNNGWYDYRYADNLPGRNFLAWKRAFWIDSTIAQPMSDDERMDRVLIQIQAQLAQARRANKQVLLMTHFVPRREFIRYTADDRFWNMANALMGSPRLGQLAAAYQVPYVLFGHLHRHFWPQHLGAVTYLNQALGYHNRRLNEWDSPDFMTEWRHRLKIMTLS
ncbi:metallophosphoesterase [Levilactobacillus namurensis]|uniref:metallophosphoesterase n=1 Tax=Levilactobacillus namurensis TaxID=380393 RepID=UPI001D5D8F6A|nr:metallophosphoesterase [Levilactobacillus namurensis]HJE45922.1 metallophosphoesterase [Levilactobacillus namurensis]